MTAGKEKPPQVLSWAKLDKTFGRWTDLQAVRKDISFGISTRLASKFLNIPFLAAADIVYGMGKEVDHTVARSIFSMIRQGKSEEAVQQHGKLAKDLIGIWQKYQDPSSRRIAIDDTAKKYFESYLGPYGKEMVREIKKRVRADMAKAWLTKHGVDAVAAEYWSTYYGAYGEQWVSIVPKKISPKSVSEA